MTAFLIMSILLFLVVLAIAVYTMFHINDDVWEDGL